VEICCESWTDAQVSALHRRGDCYLSLHKGEGWGYPLCDAACRGTPVVATAWAGPVDHLNVEDHFLVRYRLGPVQQHQTYYDPRGRWAEPDVEHAAELLRWIYENQALARQRAGRAAPRLCQQYSFEAVGRMARARLMLLLWRDNPERWRELQEREEGMGREVPA
jgi:glycosyltransferase involved in cell wall biosynthesis